MGVEMGRVSGFLKKIDSTIVVYESVDADIFDKQISEKFHQVRGNEKCNKIIESVDYDSDDEWEKDIEEEDDKEEAFQTLLFNNNL